MWLHAYYINHNLQMLPEHSTRVCVLQLSSPGSGFLPSYTHKHTHSYTHQHSIILFVNAETCPWHCSFSLTETSTFHEPGKLSYTHTHTQRQSQHCSLLSRLILAASYLEKVPGLGTYTHSDLLFPLNKSPAAQPENQLFSTRRMMESLKSDSPLWSAERGS